MRRKFSELVKAAENKPAVDASKASAVVAPKAPVQTSGGSSFFQRLSSFFAGLGVGFGLSAYFIVQKLDESNESLQRDIDKLKASVGK